MTAFLTAVVFVLVLTWPLWVWIFRRNRADQPQAWWVYLNSDEGDGETIPALRDAAEARKKMIHRPQADFSTMTDAEWFANAIPTVIVVNEEQWEVFVRMLDEPGKPSPKLEELFARRQRIWKDE